MSDDESIISDDIDYRSNDESISYHASSDEYEDDASEVSKPLSQNTQREQPPIPERSKDVFKGKDIKKVVAPVLSRTNSMSSNDYDNYSAEFDDISAQSLLYSNDFEIDKEKTIDTSRHEVRAVPVKVIKDVVASIPIQTNTMRLPGVDFVSLQAEIALEEISKEVVRLRNQQRNLLQERRHIAREKKTRAESRRAQYEVELRDLKQKLSDSEDRCRQQLTQSSAVEKSLEHAIYGKNILQSDLELREKESNEIKVMLSEMQNTLNESVEKHSMARAQMKIKEDKWALERADFAAEIQRAQLLASVVQQSLEANELRLARERDRLPDEHRRLLDEQLSRNKTLEGFILDRESSLKAEEIRRFATLEKRARESTEDISRLKMRTELELMEERQKIQNQRQRMDEERKEMEERVAADNRVMSVLQMAVTRRESALLVETSNLKRLQGEFEASKAAVEPMLRATIADRDEARALLDRAEQVALEAEERAASVLSSERGLRHLEQDTIQREKVAEEIRSKYFEARKLLQQEAVKLINSQKDLSAEKFRLHSAAIELASQASGVRHAVGQISKYGRLTQTAENSDPSTALSIKINAGQQSKAKQIRNNRNNEENSPTPDSNKEKNIYIESLNSMDFERNNVDRSKVDNNLKRRNNYENNDIDKNNNGDDYGDDSDDADDIEESGTPRQRVLEENNLRSKSSYSGSKPDPSRIDSFSKFNHLSSSIQSIAEKLTEEPSKRSPQYSQSIVFPSRRQAPFDFMGDSDGYADYKKYDRGPETRTPTYMHDIESRDPYNVDSDFRRSYSADRKYLPEISDAADDDWRKIGSMRHSSHSTTGDNPDIFSSLHNFEDSNLRLSVDNASEQASGLLLAAAKYGIFK